MAKPIIKQSQSLLGTPWFWIMETDTSNGWILGCAERVGERPQWLFRDNFRWFSEEKRLHTKRGTYLAAHREFQHIQTSKCWSFQLASNMWDLNFHRISGRICQVTVHPCLFWTQYLAQAARCEWPTKSAETLSGTSQSVLILWSPELLLVV